MDIPLALPDITEREIELVNEVLRSDRLSLGPRQVEFERAVCRFIGCRHACAVSSGTAALHLAMIGHDIGPGDEVITSSFSFIASANCVLYVGARVVFAEIDPDTWNLDPDAVEAAITPRTKAIIPVHIFGQPCPMDRIMEIAEKHHLPVIEDSCEAIGASFEGRKVGTIGRCGTFAFYPNKQITTGEGGMLITDDADLDALARSLRNQGRAAKSTWLAHERLGYNYRMSELHAALGVAQMERIDEIIHNRERVAKLYIDRLGGYENVVLQRIEPNIKMSWFVFVVRLADEFSRDHRDRLIRRLGEHGIGSSAYFTPIHLQRFYRAELNCRPEQLPITEKIGERTFALPFHTKMPETHVDRVCETVKKLIETL